MPIASTQTQEGGCTPHWRHLFSALYTVISPYWSTGTLEHWDTGALDTGDRLTVDHHLTLSEAENHKKDGARTGDWDLDGARTGDWDRDGAEGRAGAAAVLGVWTGSGLCSGPGMRNQAGPGPEARSWELALKWPGEWSANTEGSRIGPPSTIG